MKEYTQEDLEPTIIKDTYCLVGRLLGEDLYLKTDDEKKIKIATKILNEKLYPITSN